MPGRVPCIPRVGRGAPADAPTRASLLPGIQKVRAEKLTAGHAPASILIQTPGLVRPALPVELVPIAVIPFQRHFVLALTDLAARNIPPARVLHVAQSLRADVRPANLLGQDVVWIDREGRGLGHTGFGAELTRPMATFPTLDAFVAEFLG